MTSGPRQLSVPTMRYSKSSLSPKRKKFVTVIYDYIARQDDELTIHVGDVIELLSRDSKISGDEGWWIGKLGDCVGIFPNEFVVQNEQEPLDRPLEIPYSEIHVEKIIGLGGFNKVYVGKWRNEPVAIKAAIHDANSDMNKMIENTKQEAQLFWLLRHENICDLYGMCIEPPQLCLVMEYCCGGTLNSALNGRNIPPWRLVNFAIQIANGMNYLHNGAPIPLIHRDLKSINVLLTRPFEIDDKDPIVLKITDFGLARESYKTTRMSAGGTYAWMAPEAIRHGIYSQGSDVWSYGVVLWELLTGEIPYKDIANMAICYGVAVNKLTLPIPTTCPEVFKKMMQDCWSPDPHDRPDFPTILSQLREIAESEFMGTEGDSFRDLQQDWRAEIEQMLEEVRQKETEIRSREDEVMRLLEQIKVERETMEKREEELSQRELQVFARELQIYVQSEREEHPQPKKRRGRFRRADISSPSGFQHRVTVQSSPPPHSQPSSPTPRLIRLCPSNSPSSSQAPPLQTSKGKTWGPSSVHQKARSKSCTPLPITDEKRWSSSAPNLERAQTLGPATMHINEDAFNRIGVTPPQNLIYDTTTSCLSGGFGIRDKLHSSRGGGSGSGGTGGVIGACLGAAAALLVGVGLGFDFRRSNVHPRYGVGGDRRDSDDILRESRNGIAGTAGDLRCINGDDAVESSAVIARPIHNTYHGITQRQRPALESLVGGTRSGIYLPGSEPDEYSTVVASAAPSAAATGNTTTNGVAIGATTPSSEYGTPCDVSPFSIPGTSNGNVHHYVNTDHGQPAYQTQSSSSSQGSVFGSDNPPVIPYQRTLSNRSVHQTPSPAVARRPIDWPVALDKVIPPPHHSNKPTNNNPFLLPHEHHHRLPRPTASNNNNNHHHHSRQQQHHHRQHMFGSNPSTPDITPPDAVIDYSSFGEVSSGRQRVEVMEYCSPVIAASDPALNASSSSTSSSPLLLHSKSLSPQGPHLSPLQGGNLVPLSSPRMGRRESLPSLARRCPQRKAPAPPPPFNSATHRTAL